MVDDESSVLPAPAALGPGDGDSSAYDDELARLSAVRPSRPSLDDGWEDDDHYHAADAPSDAFHGTWEEVHHDLDEIKVNGAIELQWKRGMAEVKQIVRRVKHIIGREDVRRQDLVLYFFGPHSPLASLFYRRLEMQHRDFLKFMITCLRLSANNWNTAKLYDEDHHQLNVDACMERSSFTRVWQTIATCGLPKTREEAANGEIPLWEDVQAKVNMQFRAICIEGRAELQSYVIDDHKLHCEVNPYKNNNLLIKVLKHVLDNR